MNLKRQLLLVSMLMLVLPWAGCEFIRETESALRSGQQQMLTGTARALANALSQYAEEFPPAVGVQRAGEQLYLHELPKAPRIDGYVDDWQLKAASLRTMNGVDGPIRVAIGAFGSSVYVYAEVSDRNIVYATAQTMLLDDGPRYADRVSLMSSSPPYLEQQFLFAAEAPGPIISYRKEGLVLEPVPSIGAHWQDIPGGYRIEARVPDDLLGPNLGFVVANAAEAGRPAIRTGSYSGRLPAPVVRSSEELRAIAETLVLDGTRIIVTDAAGWRIATSGRLSATSAGRSGTGGWSRRIYDLLVESGEDAASAEPDPGGREREPYVGAALQGRETASWFRGEDSGTAIVAVAAPITNDRQVLGALVLQQNTDAILSLTNAGLARLINVTLLATALAVGALLGYASWLSRRIRRLSVAAEHALDTETLPSSLPSALAEDEIGDLSRSFSHVLRQLGDYNAYLKTLASKLSHELRTPLAIVTSSLENLEHETLSESSAGYTARAREGADRLRHILSAMSEASRVEELMENAEPESFDLRAVLGSTIGAYRDVYARRQFEFDCSLENATISGSPELIIQMLDKLVDNAVDFSTPDDTVRLGLGRRDGDLILSVTNPGPPLPERMRTQMFDSMVSMRGGENSHHLGLGLYVAKLIAEGHGGSIAADNVTGGVRFEIRLPGQDSR